MTVQDLPALNASLNGLCTVWLLAGYFCIRTGRRKAHSVLMVMALVTAVFFFVGYISHHTLRGGEMTRFPKEYPVARWIYLCILVPHSILAAANVPLIVLTVIAAARQSFDRHRKLARWAFPIWVFVSITGVLVYMMVYQWFPGGTNTVEPAADAAEAKVVAKSGGEPGVVSFDSTMFEYHARPEEEVLHVSFVMTNSGSSPVKITGLDTSCTCLDVRADRKVLAPGEKARIEADFSLSKLVGTAEKFVYVKTNLPEYREFRLSVRVTMDPLFEIEPKMLDWVVGEKAVEKRIRFRVLRDQPVNIISVTSSRESVSVRKQVIESGKAYDLILKPESTVDTLLGMVRIVTDCEIEKHQIQLAYFSVKQAEQEE